MHFTKTLICLPWLIEAQPMEVGVNNEQSSNLGFYPLVIYSPIFAFLHLGFCFSLQLHITMLCYIHFLIVSLIFNFF